MSDEYTSEFLLFLKNIYDEKSEFYVKPELFQNEQLKGFKNPTNKSNDVYLLNLIITCSDLKTMPMRNDDVFLVGYPKSGTSWMQEILWLLLNNLDYEKAKENNIYARSPWIDSGFLNPKMLEAMPSPRVFKSHLHTKFYPADFHKTARVNHIF